MEDFIRGERFITVSDFVYAPGKNNRDCNPLFNTFHVNHLQESNIIYTHTMYVKSLFEQIKGLKNRFVIITHNCDENVNDSFVIPDNVVQWFSQNVNYTHPKLQSLPIGLENEKWTRSVPKPELMKAKLRTARVHKNLLYLNHNTKTNPKERELPYQLLGDKPWVTAVHGVNGNFLQFTDYLSNLYSHAFILCPEGNGIDTHRTWEALYMGTIPIEKRNINNQFYTDLPICFVDSWEEITETFLFTQLTKIRRKTWNTEKLQFEYWKDKIMNYDF
jgi:hypothetical protein